MTLAAWVGRLLPSRRLGALAVTLLFGETGRRVLMATAGILAFRALPTEAIGHLTLAIAWATFLRMVCAGGVPLVLRRDFERGSPVAHALWNDGTAIVAHLTLLGLVLAAWIASTSLGIEIGLVFFLVVLHHMSGALVDCYRATQIAQGLGKRAALLDLVSGGLLLALTIIAYVVMPVALVAFAASYAISGVASLLLAPRIVSEVPRLAFRLPSSSSRVFSGSLPFLLEALIVNGYFRLSTTAVYGLDGPASSGLYSTGQSLALLFGAIPTTFGMAALPRIVAAARTGTRPLRNEVYSLWRSTLPLGFATIGILVASAPYCLPMLLGPRGRGVVPFFCLFCASRFPVFISAPAIYGMDALHQQRTRVAVALGAAAFTAALGVPATYLYGATGMTVTLAVLEFFVAAAYVILFMRATRANRS